MTSHPISTTYLDQQQARVSAALPAAGAWDADPTVMPCAGFDFCTLYFSYTEGDQAATGAFDFKIEVSPDSTGAVWHQLALYEPGAVAAGVDAFSEIQREEIGYGAVGATIERFTYDFTLDQTVERMRVFGQERGVVGTPGTLEIEARFGYR
jgi:hypothetical protein